MPTCFLACEGCGTRHPSVVDEQTMAQLQNGKTYPKHCLVCRTTTDWVFAFLDRRAGIDRRRNSDRRSSTPDEDG
jgi:hypothetical protein